MCYPTPGPMCSTSAYRQLKDASKAVRSQGSATAKQAHVEALQNYLMTPDGQDILARTGDTAMLTAVQKMAKDRAGHLFIPQVLVLRGISGSGKSTWARAWVAEDEVGRVRVNRDEIRVELFGDDVDYSAEQEDKVTIVEKSRVEKALSEFKDVVVDATHTNDYAYRTWGGMACRLGAEAVVKVFDISVEEAKVRVGSRAAGGGLHVPDEVIERQHKNLLKAEERRLTLP